MGLARGETGLFGARTCASWASNAPVANLVFGISQFARFFVDFVLVRVLSCFLFFCEIRLVCRLVGHVCWTFFRTHARTHTQAHINTHSHTLSLYFSISLSVCLCVYLPVCLLLPLCLSLSLSLCFCRCLPPPPPLIHTQVRAPHKFPLIKSKLINIIPTKMHSRYQAKMKYEKRNNCIQFKY